MKNALHCLRQCSFQQKNESLRVLSRQPADLRTRGREQFKFEL